MVIQQNTKGNLRFQKSTNKGGLIQGFTVAVGFLEGGLLTIFSSRVGAYSRGAFEGGLRGVANSRIYSTYTKSGWNSIIVTEELNLLCLISPAFMAVVSKMQQ